MLVKPDTVVAWHRRGFRLFWTWKSRHRTGRPTVPADVRELIRTMSHANPLWGAPRIHGELRKLGIAVGQSTVAKYMAVPIRNIVRFASIGVPREPTPTKVLRTKTWTTFSYEARTRMTVRCWGTSSAYLKAQASVSPIHTSVLRLTPTCSAPPSSEGRFPRISGSTP
jgi:hypothetical protein